jgi:protein-S-isoprenylcysteine O-methyltransferase Ste14
MLAKWLAQTIICLGIIAILLFVPAGTVNWSGAWISLVETAVVSVVFGLWLARYDPELLKERLRPPMQKGQSTADKIVTGLLLVLYLGWFVFMGLDAVRFKWSEVPAWLAAPGALGILLACYIAYLVFRENSFAAPVVKVQKERAQTVVTTGPYRYVRHPLYRHDFLLARCTSPSGFLLGAPMGPGLVCIIRDSHLVEERTLKTELQGYREYTARVRYRLIPLAW